MFGIKIVSKRYKDLPMKFLYSFIFLFLTTLTYGQKSVLLQNTNTRAEELKHYLSHGQDSLILEGQRTIYEVMIYNANFERVIKVKKSDAKVIISDIPVGRYAVEVVLKDKLIVITLLRNEIIENTIYTHKIMETAPREVAETNMFGSDNSTYNNNLNLSGKKASPFKNSLKPSEMNSGSNELKYWVLYKINNGSSSEKLLRIADQKTVDRLIKKIEIDKTTSTGRLNELTVWQIYDPKNFTTHKRKHKKNYMNIESDSFNIVPYYNVDYNLDD